MSRYAPPVTPEDLAVSVRAAVLEWVSQSGQVLEIPAELRLERPKSREHGDYATNIALALSKSAQLSPRVIAESLAPLIAEIPGVAAAEIAGPGFINIRLDSATLGQTAQIIVAAGAAYGTGAALAGQQINVEFISANPTGPLHLGHTRWAAVGDAIARVLVAAGAKVSTEFYINDRGVQMDKFGASVMASAHDQVIPEDGYQGAYIHDLAAAIVIARPSIKELPIEEQFISFREAAYALQLKQQQQVLEQFRTHFDLWASERALHESNSVEHGLDRLRAQGHVYELDGAVWL
ncbi:MAG: arginine--tRNA ligase, partial [Actinobacteria bacterium]|nr:arginine--tRNA ligase [Actinomycetota bacterium]